MPDVFPTAYFAFNTQEVNIERQTLKGGTSLSGEQDLTSTDGGGRVFAEFADGHLIDRAKNMAWRALITQLEEGVTQIVVPFCDPRHQPFVAGSTPPREGVPHSDKTPFSDASLYRSGEGDGVVSIAAPLRATSLDVEMPLADALVGGEWFAIEHPNKGWRAYRVRSIVGRDGNRVSLTFRPPLREAVKNGEAVNFSQPRCLMVSDGRPGNRMEYRRYTQAAIRFVEAP